MTSPSNNFPFALILICRENKSAHNSARGAASSETDALSMFSVPALNRVMDNSASATPAIFF